MSVKTTSALHSFINLIINIGFHHNVSHYSKSNLLLSSTKQILYRFRSASQNFFGEIFSGQKFDG